HGDVLFGGGVEGPSRALEPARIEPFARHLHPPDPIDAEETLFVDRHVPRGDVPVAERHEDLLRVDDPRGPLPRRVREVVDTNATTLSSRASDRLQGLDRRSRV